MTADQPFTPYTTTYADVYVGNCFLDTNARRTASTRFLTLKATSHHEGFRVDLSFPGADFRKHETLREHKSVSTKSIYCYT